jgi:putative ABC transport system permease protein
MHIFKTSVRSIKRNKVFSLINIVGLAIGIAVFLMITEYVATEWNANRFHQNYDRLYRVASTSKEGTQYYLPPGYGPILKERFPGVQASVRVAEGIGGGVISYSEGQKEVKAFREQQVFYVDGNFLDVFSFEVLKGSPSLRQPATLALTEKMALKLFGSADGVGRAVTISNQFGNTVYTVAAVIKDMPANSDIKASILLSIHTLESAANRDGNDWADPSTLNSGFLNIYCLLNKGVDPIGLEAQITSFTHEFNPQAKGSSVVLQPFKYLHLAPDFSYPYQTYGSMKLVFMLLMVSLLILLIAWVNYINLSTVQALKRAKETGVRKVLGASRSQIARQFLSETLLVTVFSLIIALVFVQLFQPVFNQFTGKDLSLSALNKGWFWALAAGIVVLGSLLSGSYVAFVLSSYKPMATLRGKVGQSNNGYSLRKGLVVFQFAISVVFIIATIVLYKQLVYMRTESLGMKLEQLLVIQGPTVSSEGQAERNFTFKNQLRTLPFVKKVAASNNVPGRGYNFSAAGITPQNPSPGDEKKGFNMFIADEQFFDTYGISFAAGQSFSENDAIKSWNNVPKVILNEKSAAQLKFKDAESAIGKKILWGKEYEVIGVVKDYHHLSLHSTIEPVIYLASVSYSYFTVQTDLANIQDKIATIEKMYKAAFPGNPYEYFFADETFNQQYRSEQDLGSIFIVAALIAIFIACLGLFGLAAFSARQRIKEIGIRKVLGASVTDITSLLSKDFIVLVIVAILIGSPVAWWGMSRWLQDFPYRTTIDWWVFLVAGLAAVVIALATVSTQAIRAALTNPVNSLKTE